MTNKRILLILDLNGTLIDRITSQGQKLRAPQPRHFRLNHFSGYWRPYLDTFLDSIFRHYAVAAWTSAQPENAIPLFETVFGEHAKDLVFGWDRPRCDLQYRRDNPKPLARKDLRKVWSDPNINADGRWSPYNTILIEDTCAKVVFTPENGLHLPTFDVCDPSSDGLNDTALLSLVKYLEEMRTTDFNDVRSYLKRRPAFHVDEDGNATQPFRNYAIDEETDAELINRFPKNRRPQELTPSPPKRTKEEMLKHHMERKRAWEEKMGQSAEDIIEEAKRKARAKMEVGGGESRPQKPYLRTKTEEPRPKKPYLRTKTEEEKKKAKENKKKAKEEKKKSKAAKNERKEQKKEEMMKLRMEAQNQRKEQKKEEMLKLRMEQLRALEKQLGRSAQDVLEEAKRKALAKIEAARRECDTGETQPQDSPALEAPRFEHREYQAGEDLESRKHYTQQQQRRAHHTGSSYYFQRDNTPDEHIYAEGYITTSSRTYHMDTS